MSPTTPDTPRFAGTSCSRIEFVPSRRAGAAAVIWLLTAVALVLQSDLSQSLRLLLAGLVVATGGATLWRFVFLRGPRALRALEWPAEEGEYHVFLGHSGRRLRASPEGCRQYGTQWWLLRFQTADGVAQLLVDTGYQDAQALRRLGRCLFRDSGAGEGPVPAVGRQGTDTIGPKV